MKKEYSNVRGTIDFSEREALIYEYLREKSLKFFKLYQYQQLILPLLEEESLFIKGVGQGTDIVQGQMMKIEGKSIVLRPEATAQIVRHYLQHRLDKKNNFYKFFYIGPMFRGERPQKGRLRQFNHIGAEAVGSNSFYLDAEIIKLALDIVNAAGIEKKELQINSLGCAQDKKKSAKKIKNDLAKDKKKLCSNCQKRLERNPLRVLDCKLPSCRKVAVNLELDKSHLCLDCRQHFENLLTLLDQLEVTYNYQPNLVRGLDYYTNTVFEITSSQLGAQDALGAGGRYNNLFHRLGAIEVPAVGFALGVERMILALDHFTKPKEIPSVFIAKAGVLEREVFFLSAGLRRQGIASNFDFCGKSLKAQMRYAQKTGAELVVILGEKEFNKKEVILRDMKNSKQETVKLEELAARIRVASRE